MNPPTVPEPNLNPPERGKTLFGALAGQIQIRIECIEEWDAAKEGVFWEAAAALSDSDESLTPEEQYIRGYQLYPETEEELGWTSTASEEVLADMPWEDELPQSLTSKTPLTATTPLRH